MARIFPEGGLKHCFFDARWHRWCVRDRWFLISVIVSICHCNSPVSNFVLVFLISSYAAWNFSDSFEFLSFKRAESCFYLFLCCALQLYTSRGMFTALRFQLCSAKLTGVVLAVSASVVALFLVTINNKHYGKLTLVNFVIIHWCKIITVSLNYQFTDYLPQKILKSFTEMWTCGHFIIRV